ncbi:hypothetical protein QQ054_31935 [Oscillatoria amoena NRMC-F 0135]|nr:hypothetical protein [Oscillatoria amoena NRMC-F 0135]
MELIFFYCHDDLFAMNQLWLNTKKCIAEAREEIIKTNGLLEELDNAPLSDPYMYQKVLTLRCNYSEQRKSAAAKLMRATVQLKHAEDLLMRETPHINDLLKINNIWPQ